jgi:hypothetical protein
MRLALAKAIQIIQNLQWLGMGTGYADPATD